MLYTVLYTIKFVKSDSLTLSAVHFLHIPSLSLLFPQSPPFLWTHGPFPLFLISPLLLPLFPNNGQDF